MLNRNGILSLLYKRCSNRNLITCKFNVLVRFSYKVELREKLYMGMEKWKKWRGGKFFTSQIRRFRQKKSLKHRDA